MGTPADEPALAIASEFETEPEPAWPDDLLSAARARHWIRSALPGRPAVAGPTWVHRAKPWGVTARFAVRAAGGVGGTEPAEVVFKATHLSLFAGAPRVYALLARHVPEAVPELLAWERSGDRAWMLFRPFADPTVEATGGLEPLLALARTLARVQVAVATLPAAEMAGLTRSSVRQVPALLDEVVRDVRDRLLLAWEADGGRMARRFGVPADLLTRIEAHRDAVVAWTEELAAGSWPETVDHVDLHTENAVLRPDGGVLILDWEEAVLSCPFFSLDRLLMDARVRDPDDGADPWQRPDANGAPLGAAEHAVRRAYLDALPWGTAAERERAFDLALRLAPIKTAHEGRVYADALGWNGIPPLTAYCLVRALRRWEAAG